jgi:hypothetical protein
MASAMTALRLISLPAHGALELLLGLAALVAPFVAGFAPAGLLVSVALGVLLVGLALSTTDVSLPVTAHFAFDHTLALATVGAALLLGLSGDRVAAVTIGTIGLAQVVLNLSTRYAARA